MLNTYFSVKFTQLKLFKFGLGGSFTYNKKDYYDVEFKEYYYTISGLVDVKLLNFNLIWLNLRERFGKQFIKADIYNSSGITLSTDLLIGYKGFYGVLALPMFFGSEGTDVSVTMGIGYQMKLF